MTTTSLELSKRLYEVSGWEPNDKFWFKIDGKDEVHCGHEFTIGKELVDFEYSLARICPAYDLGYLLRQLPPYSRVQTMKGDVPYGVSYDNGISERGVNADTPEDAAAELCIKLIEEGIITV